LTIRNDNLAKIKSDLEKSEKLFRLLSENSQDIIVIFSPDNKFEYVSPAVKKILGYSPEELIGKDGKDLLHPDDIPMLKAPGEIAGAEKVINPPHFRLRGKDGNYVWIEAYSSPIVNELGHVTGVQTVNRDITERKHTEFAMRDAKEKAEEATLAKSQFLSTMSHEIRTPMNAVLGLTNILLDESPRDDQVENLKLLKFSGDNLLTIINDILDFSKIEAGKLVLESVDFNLFDLVINTKNILEKKATEKGIKLYVNYPKEMPKVLQGDPVRVNQILTNLIGNAIKFTHEGFIEITIDASKSWDAYQVRFAVKDTGIGIESNKLDYIFQSFSQASSTNTRKYGGTGLGLAITKRLVEMMGGDITVESVHGHGSTFRFNIFLNESDRAEPLKKIEPKPYASTAGHHGSLNVKILLAEDNRINQIVANKFLKKWGIEVCFANNGREAVEMIQSKDYQLVLMDLQMPDVDGYTATKMIRGIPDPYFANIPIIALTASAMIEIREKAIGYGMNDYITKPFDPDELRSKIFQFITREERINVSGSDAIDDLYTQSNPKFKRQLAGLIKKNIIDLRQAAADMMINKNRPDHFLEISHRTKVSIHFLGDTEFESLIEAIRHALIEKDLSTVDQRFEKFNEVSSKLLEGLEEEIQTDYL